MYRSVVPGLNSAHSEVLRQKPADLSYLINESKGDQIFTVMSPRLWKKLAKTLWFVKSVFSLK